MNQFFGWRTAITWCKKDFSYSRFNCNSVLAFIDITVSVSADNSWFHLSRNQSWNIWNNNWLSENSSIKNVFNRSVWWFPHLLQIKLFNYFLIRCDWRTFNSHFTFFKCLTCVNCYLIFSFVFILNGKIKILGN